MLATYLYFNAALYAVFGVWCALRLDGTSRSLGYSVLSNSGHAEYLTVYGGLQWGLALAFLSLALKPELHWAGLVVALALYAPTVLHRMIGLLRYAPVEKMSYAVAGLELAMLVVAAVLWFAGRSH